MSSRQLVEVLADVYAHGPGKDVRPGPAPPYRAPAAPGGVALTALAATGAVGDRLVKVLTSALAPRRYEPWNGFNEHRAYPSPRAAYLVDVAVRCGDADWLVDPVRGRLHPVRPGSVPAAVPVGSAGPMSLAAPTGLVLWERPGRLPAGYGRLADALAALEAGHVAGALVEAAAGHGLRAAVRTQGRQLTVELGPTSAATGSRHRPPAVRSSGLSPRGLSPDPRPLPAAVFDRLVAAAYRPPTGSPAAWPGLRHTVAVGNVTDRPAGWYDLPAPAYPAAAGSAAGAATSTASTPVVPTRPGDAIGQVQQAYTYSRTEVDVAGMPAAWLVSADVGAVVRADGPVGYRRLLHTAGALAQHVGTAAAEAGLFCRPVRAVREAAAEAAAALPAGHDLIYLLLIGRSRVRDFAYDLSDPEVPL
ncbi:MULTISPECIES: nitroreductase family protein [unclassified Solwaraspora]|uniref:nitroreductase family protein n=1 Tax=unclassified Solwaraspora TaxID=2627926 RepID=UPI00259BB19C|nr:nitroreductase family protein [Solwaraspora sp. WMMA2056]WJK40062.1 nitroreductase family protein [Solwaraspora sp. WMMA2056]